MNDVILNHDCLHVMSKLPDECVELCFADPPFNISFEYDLYCDNLDDAAYLAWSRKWCSEVKRLLKPDGTFWLAIGDAYASDLDVICRRELGFRRRSWVVWYYTFGVNCTNKFTPSHTHLFHYVKDPNFFTFNATDIKIPSARQLKYNDKRAKKGGRLPDDTWVLLPKDYPELFDPEKDVWLVSRLCGTHKERVEHSCQMPEAVLERIIKTSSNPGDLVFDPFAGSGTSLVVAKKLKRHYLGCELSPAYTAVIKKRLLTCD